MKLAKVGKYLIVSGILAAILFSPVTKAIAAVSAVSAETKASTEPEETVQEMLKKAHEALVQEGEKAENQTVAGTKTKVKGLYWAKSVKGVAFQPAVAQEKTYVRVGDTDKKKSYAAMATADAVAKSMNAKVGPCINVQYGMKEGKDFVRTTEGSAGIVSLGIPDNFRTEGAKYALVAVYAGGEYKVFENAGTDPAVFTTVVDQASSADVMYALIQK